MPLNYRVLNSKKTIKMSKDGKEVEFKDLFTKGIDDDIPWVLNSRLVEVTKEYVARPDLVAFVVYGSDEYADIICKINGISNPFELNEGELLYCPDLSVIPSLASYKASEVEGLIDNDSDNVEKTKTNYKKSTNEKRSPNEATTNEHNYVLGMNDAVVFY